MKRYDNGELITADSMEKEDWYGTLYEPFITFASKQLTTPGSLLNDPGQLMEDVVKEFKQNSTDISMHMERILRWSVLFCERANCMYYSSSNLKSK